MKYSSRVVVVVMLLALLVLASLGVYAGATPSSSISKRNYTDVGVPLILSLNTTGIQKPSVVWLVNGTEVSNSLTYMFVANKPGIYPVEYELNGVNKTVAGTYNITVYADPFFTSFTKHVSSYGLYKDNVVKVSLSVAGGSYPYVYGWFVNGQFVGQTSTPFYTFTLSKPGTYSIQAKVSDSAGYILSSSIIVDSVSYSIILFIIPVGVVAIILLYWFYFRKKFFNKGGEKAGSGAPGDGGKPGETIGGTTEGGAGGIAPPAEKKKLFSLPFGSKKKKVPAGLIFKPQVVSSIAVKGQIVGEYDVGMAHIVVVNDEGIGRYIIQEPKMTEQEQSVYGMIMEALYYSLKPMESGDPMAYVEQFIWQAAEDLGIVDEVKASYQTLRYYIQRDSVGYGIIDVLMSDDNVEEISCEGSGKPVAIIHRMYAQFNWLDTNIIFEDEDSLRKYVQKLVQKAGKSITTAVPFADASTKEGDRIAATLGTEISTGSTFDIRRFPKNPLTVGHLMASRSMTPLMAAYYWLMLEAKGFVFVIGTMGCYDTKTEVMTKSGWKYFRDVSMDDEILTMNPETFQYEYVRPVKKFAYRYTGNMVEYEDEQVSFRVTPDNAMFVKVDGKYQMIRAFEMLGHKTSTVMTGKGTEAEIKASDIKTSHYDDYVYDLKLPIYHLLYTRRNGKTLWAGNSGKTTALNSLVSLVPLDMKVVTIEETLELNLPHIHWQRLHTRTSYSATETKYDVDSFQLTKLSLRLRPDYLIVGEARGEEITTLFQAAAVGAAAISTFHADSPEAALVRMSAPPLNVGASSQMLIWSIMLMRRIRLDNGAVVRRAVVSKEVDESLKLHTIFEWDPRADRIFPAGAKSETDIDMLVKNSVRLKEVMDSRGWDEARLRDDLSKRLDVMNRIVANGKYDYADVSKAVKEFYLKEYGMDFE